MRPKIADTIEALLRDAYGSREGALREPQSAEDMLRGYYGAPLAAVARYGVDDTRSAPASRVTTERRGSEKKKKRAAPCKTSVQCCQDNGETLLQRRRDTITRRTAEAFAQTVSPEATPQQEARLDLAPAPTTNALAVPLIARELPLAALPPPAAMPPRAPPMASPAPPPPPNAALPAVAEPPCEASGEDDFAADLEAILRGEKVFDPATKKTVSKDSLTESRANTQPPSPAPAPSATNESQAIFDRIAQSMTYANAYDLGTVDLDNRFAAFDRNFDARRDRKARPKEEAPTVVEAPPRAALRAKSPSGSEFIADLDAIGRTARASAPSLATSMSESQLSRALYDTGEHVLAAESTFEDRLSVGVAPGVLFSYGQIIAMADMFPSVEGMNAASAQELQAIKALIVRSTQYYKDHSAGNPSSAEWQAATNQRYLPLAEDNYDHFAPNVLFRDAAFASRTNQYGNHKRAWESHHSRAIDAKRTMALDPSHRNTSFFAAWPLTINAFGDHFLTDAFAAGHVINKRAVIELYESVFYDASGLTAAARRFLQDVATRAFVGDVAAQFSRLETGNTSIMGWHPNIDSAERFAQVLVEIATQERGKVANLAVKVIHDKLNRDGVQVTNDAGSGTWTLTGDGHLSAATLQVMRRAVQQSIDNLDDPAILVSPIDYQPFFDLVWRYVPKLTAASEAQVRTLTAGLIRPTSSELIEGAAALIREEAEFMINELVRRGALRRA